MRSVCHIFDMQYGMCDVRRKLRCVMWALRYGIEDMSLLSALSGFFHDLISRSNLLNDSNAAIAPLSLLVWRFVPKLNFFTNVLS